MCIISNVSVALRLVILQIVLLFVNELVCAQEQQSQWCLGLLLYCFWVIPSDVFRVMPCDYV